MTDRLRRWWSSRTLVWRLIAGLLVLLLATCTAIGVATSLALHSFLIDRLDQQLADAGPRLAFNLEHATGGSDGRSGRPTDFDDTLLRGQQLGTFAARLVGGKVTNAAVARESDHQVQLVQVSLGADEIARLRSLPVTGEARSVHLGSLGGYRLAAVRGGDGDILVTGLPLDSVDSTMHRLEAVEIVVFLAALGLAGLAGAASVRLSLRPLRRVTHTALDVARTPLASGEVSLPARVPDDNATTEVGQVGAAVNQMLGHVERSLAERHATEERLRQFIADASHELRTPLAAIRSHAELAGRDEDALPDGVRHALRRVEAEASRMGVLVDDLLLLARLDAGRPLAREPVDLTRLVIDVTSDAQAASRDHRWTLELPEEPIVVTGDDHRLHQVLANLLANARTHTPAGTTVTVALDEAPDGGARLQVCDDGPGIPPELQGRVFERFVRADAARTRASGSSGLGLSIVAAVVEAHGGQVRVSSRPGRTCFEVTLPLTAGLQAVPR